VVHDTGRMGLTGWRAGIARLLAVAFLLASLLVPPFAEAASPTVSSAAVAASAAADQDGGTPALPSRPHGIVHAGSHCACQVADRLVPPEQTVPAVLRAIVHPTRTARAVASLAAEPPARPPQA